MFYLGAYRLSNYKNINSIPDVIKASFQKQNGIIYIISDCLFSKESFDTSPVFNKSKRLISSLIRQINVFDNVEAIILNGNILRNAFTNQGNVLVSREEYSYTFLKSLIYIAKKTPIYYIRGCYDCYINNNLFPADIRGVIKICNLLQLGDITFIHGHTNLPFITDSDCSLINSIEERDRQIIDANLLAKEFSTRLVVSNSNCETVRNGSVVSVGSFLSNSYSVINTNGFDILNI